MLMPRGAVGILAALLAVALSSQAWADDAQARSDAALEAGRAALRGGEYRPALGHFREAVDATPDHVDVHLARASAANLLGEFDEALGALRTVLGLAPTPDHYARLGAMLERMGKSDEAIAAFRVSLSDPWLGRAEVAEQLLLVLVDTGDRAGAAELARAQGWYATDRDYCRDPVPNVTWLTGRLLALLAQPDRADCLAAVAEQLTDDGYTRLPRRLLNHVIALTRRPQVREQATMFLRSRLPAHDVPALAEALNAAGYTLARRGLYADAMVAYQRAIAADPRFSWPLSNLGLIYRQDGDHLEALEWFRRAVAANPEHRRAYRNIAYSADQVGRSDEALAAYQRTLSLDPGDAWAMANMGSLLFRMGRETEGIHTMQRALRLDPSLTWVREYLDRRVGPEPRMGPTPFGARE
jgi:tetratricopeptide (TPR) repeat protein